jgi:methyltransferase (TIGR00027 family)
VETGQPSRTALAAASHRAAHQVLEGGRIFSDPLAIPILGLDAATLSEEASQHPRRKPMRIFIAARTRFAEDALTSAVERGVRQLVVLGAGLDTYAYRGALRERLRIFEVDHPATQAWKRHRLESAGISVPGPLTFAPVDFENTTLAEGLGAAGFDPAMTTFFTWLGVVPYLTEDAVWSTLGYIAGLPGGAHVVFDYSDPPDSLSPEMRKTHDLRAARVAELGEPWINYFDAEELQARLLGIGFSEVEDLGPREIAARWFPKAAATIPERGGHVVRAAIRVQDVFTPGAGPRR